jgi:hypothetical protein
MSRDGLEVADVFRHFGPAFLDQHGASLSAARRRAMLAIESCRTAALGGHVERCGDCGYQRVAYNSCRHHACPKCQGLARAQWLEDRQAELLDVPYFHVVFTIPQQIEVIAFQNQTVVYDILFRAASETLRKIAADQKHLGAEIGFLGVLHTPDQVRGRLWGATFNTTQTCTFWFLAAESHRTVKAGPPAGRDASCRSRCCHGCSGACYCTIWKGR